MAKEPCKEITGTDCIETAIDELVFSGEMKTVSDVDLKKILNDAFK